eukprot:4918289-Heterocapsa_arctica.AAC.1
MDMKYVKQNSTTYAVCVIATFSKLGDVQYLANKDSASVYNALQTSFNFMGFPMPRYSDDGGELER